MSKQLTLEQRLEILDLYKSTLHTYKMKLSMNVDMFIEKCKLIANRYV